MEFIMQVCGAMLAVAGSLIALIIAVILFYALLMGIDTVREDRKAKKAKKAKKDAKK